MDHTGSPGGGRLGNATLIAGPTASGKSALALEIARAAGAEIVNADSMQVYAHLDVLTARPGPPELAAVAHRLYGHVPPQRAYSTGSWLRDVGALVAGREDRPFVFVGGTGLYFRALLGGLADIPDIAPEVRRRWRERLAAEGPAALHALLAGRDPDSAARIGPADGQRIVRALEVLDQTGLPIGRWRSRKGRPLVDAARARLVLVEPGRDELARRIARRLDAMVAAGALEEVRALLSLGLDPGLPAMKAIGVREFAAVLDGRIGLAEAVARAAAATRQYAKRQMTWFRHQAGPEWTRIAIGAPSANIGLPMSP